MLTQEELQVINRVIDFIKGNITDITKEEIDSTPDILKMHKNLAELNPIREEIEKLLYRRVDEVEYFCAILANENMEYHERTAHAFKNLPFRTSKNIEMECYLLSKLFRLKTNNYFNLISIIIDEISKDQTDKNNWNLYFDIFMGQEDIDFSSFINNPKINSQNIYPSDEEIEKNFEIAKHLYSKGYNNLTKEEQKFYSMSVGHYFEKIACQEEWDNLQKAGRPDLAQRIFWVSRYVGDGFGYDVLSFDPETEKPKLIEVKGTLSPYLIDEIILSYNEFRYFNNENLNYRMYRYYLSEDTIKRYILIPQKNEELKITTEDGTEFSYNKEAYKNKEKVKIKKM